MVSLPNGAGTESEPLTSHTVALPFFAHHHHSLLFTLRFPTPLSLRPRLRRSASTVLR